MSCHVKPCRLSSEVRTESQVKSTKGTTEKANANSNAINSSSSFFSIVVIQIIPAHPNSFISYRETQGSREMKNSVESKSSSLIIVRSSYLASEASMFILCRWSFYLVFVFVYLRRASLLKEGLFPIEKVSKRLFGMSMISRKYRVENRGRINNDMQERVKELPDDGHGPGSLILLRHGFQGCSHRSGFHH